MFIPVKSVTVADPPRISIELTIIFVASPKNMNTKCATVPQRAAMISRNVCALGALSLSLAANYIIKGVPSRSGGGGGVKIGVSHLVKKQT